MNSNIDKLLDIEKKHSLYTTEIDGVNYWEYVRFSFLQYGVIGESLDLAVNATATKRSLRVCLKWFGQIIKSFVQLYLIKKKNGLHKDILLLPHARKICIDGKYQCIYTDKLSNIYGERALSLEIPYGMGHLTPAYNKNLVYLDAIMVKSYLKEFVANHLSGVGYAKLKRQIQQQMSDVFEEIEQAYEIILNRKQLIEMISTTILRVKNYKKEYSRILENIEPKVIVEVVGYTTSWMALNEIAHEMKIPIIELQHGTMHVDHLAYQYNTDEALPQLPDYILTFSDYWNKVAHLPQNGTHLVAVGYPYFEEQIKKYKKKVQTKENKKTVLFVSQWSIGKYLCQLAATVVDLLDMDKYRIIYKLHPGEYADWKEKYECLLKEGIEVVDSLERNIYEYFAVSDVQVGVYSTAIYEGLGFGLETYIYDVGHANTMEDLIASGYASKVSSAEELACNLQSGNNQVAAQQQFWKEQSLEKMILFINECVEKPM